MSFSEEQAKTDTHNELKPDLGRKLDYLFGQATGRQHNRDRSFSMFLELRRIGIHDTRTSRLYLTEHLRQVLGDPQNIVSQDGSWLNRESLLAGPGGFLKLESTWYDNQLITIVLKRGKGS